MDEMTIKQASTPQRKECCSQCPYARRTTKEYLDSRGQNGERFLAQAFMNAILPCHMEDEEGHAVVGVGQQCAGAAKFRANTGAAGFLNPALGRLEKDEYNVFKNPRELLARHFGIEEHEALKYIVQVKTIGEMIENERLLAIEAGKIIRY